MNIKIVAIFAFLVQIESVSLRGLRSEKEIYSRDEMISEVGKSRSPVGSEASMSSQMNLLSDKGKVPSEPGVKMESSHQTVNQENIESDKRRKYINGRNNHYPTANATADFMTGQENGTWNVEKKEKTLDMGKGLHEASHAPCQVTIEELVATAQATVTRALKGLCNSKEVEERVDELAGSLTNQLNAVKTMLLNLEERLERHEDVVIYGQKQLSAAIAKGCPSLANGNGGGGSALNTETNAKNQKPSHDYPSSTLKGLNGVEDDVSQEDVSGPRDPEILKFNSSIHMETSLNGISRKVFTYYWKIKDMTYKMTDRNPRKSFRSQSFYIFPSGYRMYLRVFPRRNEDNFYVRVGLTKGEFDDNLKWPFPLKHKIHILDQTKEGMLFEDIASRIWDPNLLCSDFNWQKPIKGDNHECVEIGFPHDVLNQREYIRKDTLVIKLTVYLES